MDDKQGRTPCPYNHTPFNFRDSDPVRPSLSEVEHFETSTLVDPSYIIHLIRQLLPHAAGVKHESQQDENNITSSKDNNPMERIQDKSSVTANRNTDITNNDPEAPGSCNHQGDVSQEISTNRENNQRHMQVEDDHGTSLAEDEFSSVERKNAHLRQEVGEMLDDTEHTESKVQEDLREEAGCVLWDLAANPDHAKFMVENHLLDVLLAMLSVLIPDRMREICLGIMGNLACHAVLERAMVATIGLVQMVVQQLFFEDSPTLSETCRLLSAGLRSGEVVSWGEALQPEQVLQRILWVAANTMNSQLLEKSTELLLALVDSHKEETSSLLPSLMHLGLPEVLTDLLTCEITAISEGTPSHGEVVLDTLLQIGEALSLTDKYSAQLASNKELFGLAGKVIRLSGKDEVGPPGITAVVLVANLLAEQEKLIDEVLYDANFLNNLLELLPSASDDPGARNALWSVLGRMFGILATSQEIGPSRRDLVSVLARHSVLIAEDLDDHRDDDNGEDDKRLFERANSVSFNKGFKSKISTVSKMVHLLNDWITLDEESSVQDLSRSVRTASKQLSCTIDSQ
jgi:NTP pyrophosphatase (non-canonical NTP hydrolase)